jgi:hypothetical protein
VACSHQLEMTTLYFCMYIECSHAWGHQCITLTWAFVRKQMGSLMGSNVVAQAFHEMHNVLAVCPHAWRNCPLTAATKCWKAVAVVDAASQRHATDEMQRP